MIFPKVSQITRIIVLLVASVVSAGAAELQIRPQESGVEVTWEPPVEGLPAPTELRLQRSADLHHWNNVGTKRRLPAGVAQGSVLAQEEGSGQGFFRLSIRDAEFTASEGADVLGYRGAFDDEIEVLGDYSLEDFTQQYPPPADYLRALSWDPTTALYWTEFNHPSPTGLSPWGWREPLPPITLNSAELAVIRSQGFVVTERLGTVGPNCSDIYYDIFRRDLPVFITTDSMLHAWHRSFDSLLEDVELLSLKPQLTALLQAMRLNVPAASGAYGTGPLATSLRDADYYLGVASQLLTGVGGSSLGQSARINQTLGAIQARDADLFAFFEPEKAEWVDFSQFLPRGHYTKAFPAEWGGTLTNYFQAMTWLGRVDFRVAGNPSYASERQLGTAIVLWDLLKRSGQWTEWERINQTITLMVGPADSMDFVQLDGLLRAEGITSPTQINSLEQLKDLQSRIEAGSLGAQAIQGHSYFVSAGDDQVKLPRSFTFLGQRFTADSWAFNQVTFDRIVEPGSNPKRLVRRRLPYSLDMAFSVLGNDHVVPDLVANMSNPTGQAFRDGYQYQRNLAAVRRVLDQRPLAAWSGCVYDRWLYMLRSLSDPTTGPEYPEAMRTRAWAMKTLNTQLASWTQLRHDTLLYVKASETGPFLCSYPYGFVEPRPEFFRRMTAMADFTRQELGRLHPTGAFTVKAQPFLERFKSNCLTLVGIAEKELAQQPLDSGETNFLANVVELTQEYAATQAAGRTYKGWYPNLFYRSTEGIWPLPNVKPPNEAVKPPHDSVVDDRLVVDVHTDAPFVPDGDPGAVLHQAVGNANLLVIAVDNGPDRILYAGPVLSHYEFLTPYGTRLTDEEWKAIQPPGPPPPPWTGSYLIRR